MAEWVTIDDGTGICREDLAAFLPREGQRVLFDARGAVHVGSFGSSFGGGGYFRSLGDGSRFHVAAGQPCEVRRWLGSD